MWGIYGNAYVESIHWLFTDEAYEDDHGDYCLSGIVTTPEYMSCVSYFIQAAGSQQPKVTISDYITQLRSESKPGSYVPYDNRISITTKLINGEQYLLFSGIDYKIIETIVWSAYIYWKIKAVVEQNDQRSQRAEKILFDTLKAVSGMTDKGFSRHFLIRKTEQTFKAFLEALPVEKPKHKEEKPITIVDRSHGVQMKPLLRMMDKLWNRLGKDLNNTDKAEFLSILTGYSYDYIYNNIGGSFDLTDKQHGKDLERINKILLKFGVKRGISPDRKKKNDDG